MLCVVLCVVVLLMFFTMFGSPCFCMGSGHGGWQQGRGFATQWMLHWALWASYYCGQGDGMGELQGNEWTFFTPPLLMRYPGQTRNPCLVPVLKTSQICCYKLQANIGLCFYFPSYRALYYLPPSSDNHPISRLIAHRLKGAPLYWFKAAADLRAVGWAFDKTFCR